MGRLFSLFVCYGAQESGGAMDAGEGSCIEDGLVEGTTEAIIKGKMKKKEEERFLVQYLWFVDCLAGC